MNNEYTKSLILSACIVALAGSASGSDKVVASASLGTLVVPTASGLTVQHTFAGLTEPISGVGLAGRYVTQSGDFTDGLGPWSLDVRLTSTAPGGNVLAWNPIGGDVTIADYPLQDGTGGLPSVAGDGQWTFDFDSTAPQSNWTYRIDNAVVYLLAEAPDISFSYDALPDPANQWNRPYYIEGVSGLGPVAYHAIEFTVDVSGVYDLTSILSNTSNHFTFLYQDGFDPALPLQNLLDYGLGNGFSPFGDPKGTSHISALLLEGRTYFWVTSQWSSTSTIAQAGNTIVGPGVVTIAADCPADTNHDGSLTPADFTAWIAAFNTSSPECDQNGDGNCDPTDFTAWIANFNAGC
ncbi:MAG TPA: hypothetical protein ENJ00_08150 [Phycisphaerales bacterium]|nr:hypothetical protein [Phycisphaerales bacterium]